MIQFNKPENLNGAQLIEELKKEGIVVETLPSIEADGTLWLDINSNEEIKAKTVVENHKGNTVPNEPSLTEKLALIGLKVDDLKQALGINA